MLRRFLAIFGLALVLQSTVFALYYDDLLYLRQPVDAIARDAADVFAKHAERALGREHLTRRHLDTIADSAKAFGLHALECTALERRSAGDPADRAVRLRLADAWRRSGQLSRAEAIYLDMLATRGQNP